MLTATGSETRRPRRHLSLWLLVGWLLLVPLLASCQEETYGLGIRGYNHTDELIGQFTINGGSGGSFIGAHEGGGSTTCCASVPAKWRPEMEVTIRWVDGYFKNERERVVAVPPYGDESLMAVHFLRGGEVKVFVTRYSLGHPDYPLTGEEAEMTPGIKP